MKTATREVDAYIEKSAAFAQPILKKIRKAVHKACPDVEETLKWGHPHFAKNGMLAGMSAFKAHVDFGFWRGKELSDPHDLFEAVGKTRISVRRLERVADLPAEKILVAYVAEAVRLNGAAKDAPRPKKKAVKKAAKRVIEAPADLLAALKKAKRALAIFEAFSYSHKKEYVEWITEAVRDETRKKRVATAVEWVSAGKPRNWKYMKEWK
jgi:hypothetical protein